MFVQRVGGGGPHPIIASIRVDASEIREALCVIAGVHLIVSLMERTISRVYLHFSIALKTRTGNNIEHAVSTVAVLGRVSAALHLEIIDVLRIDLGSGVTRDVGVGNWNPVDGPG